jgi:hypothetical protein
MSESLTRLPREMIGGLVVLIMGIVVIVIGTVLLGSTMGIGAYIDKIFGNLGVEANITQTLKSYNIPSVLSVVGIVLVIAGFVLIILSLIRVGTHANALWKHE